MPITTRKSSGSATEALSLRESGASGDGERRRSSRTRPGRRQAVRTLGPTHRAAHEAAAASPTALVLAPALGVAGTTRHHRMLPRGQPHPPRGGGQIPAGGVARRSEAHATTRGTRSVAIRSSESSSGMASIPPRSDAEPCPVLVDVSRGAPGSDFRHGFGRRSSRRMAWSRSQLRALRDRPEEPQGGDRGRITRDSKTS